MNIDYKRVAFLTVLTLVPVTAFAAVAATVDAGDGGFCASLMDMFSCSGGGCPNTP